MVLRCVCTFSFVGCEALRFSDVLRYVTASLYMFGDIVMGSLLVEGCDVVLSVLVSGSGLLVGRDAESVMDMSSSSEQTVLLVDEIESSSELVLGVWLWEV